MLVDSDMVLSMNSEKGKKSKHVKFVQLFDVPSVQNPGLISIQERRDNHSSVDFQICGDMDFVLMQPPQGLASLGDLRVEIIFCMYFKLFTFVS